MGKGTQGARDMGNQLHADVLDDFKDQLVIVLLKRLADKEGKVNIPLAEMDDTGGDLVAFSINDNHLVPGEKAFNFVLQKKA